MPDTTRQSPPPITPAHARAMHRVISLWPFPKEADHRLLREIGAHLDSLAAQAPSQPEPEPVEPDCGECTD